MRVINTETGKKAMSSCPKQNNADSYKILKFQAALYAGLRGWNVIERRRYSKSWSYGGWEPEYGGFCVMLRTGGGFHSAYCVQIKTGDRLICYDDGTFDVCSPVRWESKFEILEDEQYLCQMDMDTGNLMDPVNVLNQTRLDFSNWEDGHICYLSNMTGNRHERHIDEYDPEPKRTRIVKRTRKLAPRSASRVSNENRPRPVFRIAA